MLMSTLLHGGRASRRPPQVAVRDERIPAVVVGGADNGGGLGLVRSLGIAGVPVIVVDSDPMAPALHSRFAGGTMISQMSGPSLVRNLVDLAVLTRTRPVLFLTTDETVLEASEHRAALEPFYRIKLPCHDTLAALSRKNSFQQLAEAYGFAVPRSRRIRTVSEVGTLTGLRYPAVIKPAVKTQDYLAQNLARGYRVSAYEEAEELCRRILPVLSDLIVQEWIEGPDSELYFCLQYRGPDGAVASFTGRKLSIWPPDIGTTASCIAAPEAHHELHRLTDAFFRAVSFVGMGGMEFKRDTRTGEFFMIEPTVGRVDWQEEVATLNGVNIPLAAYAYEAGMPAPELAPARQPVIWRDTARHWKAAGFRRIAVPNARTYDTYWRLNDPMPALFHTLSLSMRTLRRSLKRKPQVAGEVARKKV